MEDAKLAILTDAKQEYSHHLSNVLKTPLYKGIKSLYEEASKTCQTESRPEEVLSEFQNLLSQVRLWSQEMIDREYERISQDSQCDFIKELVTAVFMSHTQILQFIRSSPSEKKQTKLDIPKPEHFIHKCYINSAREFWKDPIWYYENDTISPNELKKNIREAESIIYNCINDTIRQLLPFRHILKTYLRDAYNEEELDQEEKNEPMTQGFSKTYQNNLREIIKNEIANYTTTKESSESEIRDLIDQELKQSDDEIEIAETSPKTLTDKINIELKEQKMQAEKDLADNLMSQDLKDLVAKGLGEADLKVEDLKVEDLKVEDFKVEELDVEDLKDIKNLNEVEQVAEDFVESVPDISLEEMISLAGKDSETEDEESEIDLEIDLEEVKTPQPGDAISFDFNEVNLADSKSKEPVKEVAAVNEPVKEVAAVKEVAVREVVLAEKETKPVQKVEAETQVESQVESLAESQVKTVDVESGETKKDDKMQNLVVEKQNPIKENPIKLNPLRENPLKENPLKENPLDNVTDLPTNEVFDPNFDLDGEVNLWDDIALKASKPEPEPEAKIELENKSDEIGPKRFKFFSRT